MHWYDRHYYDAQMAVPADAFIWMSRLRAEKFAAHVKLTDRVFEFGVGSGLDLAQLKCAARVGYDINSAATDEARLHGVEIVADVSVVSPGSFDVVICHHVLEHLVEPAAMLVRLAKLLKPVGRLLLFVPYEKQARYRRYLPNEKNHHLFSWTPQTLGNLIVACDLTVHSIGLVPFGYERVTSIIAKRIGIGERGFRALHRTALMARPESEICAVALPN